MSSKFQTALLIGIAFVVVMLYMRRPEKQIPIVQDIEVTQPEERSITVSSEGQITANLDKAEFILISETEAQELADAKLANEESVTDAVTILLSHGVEEKDIVTGPVQIRVKTGYTTTEAKVVGYIVYQSLRVTQRHLDELMPLFVAIEKEGIYKIEDIFFSVSNLDEYRERASQLAIKNAETKAKAIAREINREIGDVISIQEVRPSYSSSQYTYSFGTLEVFFRGDTNRWEKPLWIYEVTITAEILVKYELK